MELGKGRNKNFGFIQQKIRNLESHLEDLQHHVGIRGDREIEHGLTKELNE